VRKALSVAGCLGYSYANDTDLDMDTLLSWSLTLQQIEMEALEIAD
jgi:hypothetical protein